MSRKLRYFQPSHYKLEISPSKVIFWLVICTFLMGTLGFRLYQLQIKNTSVYTELAKNNHDRYVSLQCPRGTIYDRNGVLLAIDVPSYHLYANIDQTFNLAFKNLKREEKINALTTLLAKTVHMSRQEILTLLTKNKDNRNDFLVKSTLGKDEYALFNERSFELPGFFIEEGFTRNYPKGSLLAHMLGYTRPISETQLKLPQYQGYENDERTGKSGIELYYEKILHGKKGQKIQTINALGIVINEKDTKDVIKGENLYLTIDSRLQEFAEQTLQGLVGTIIVIDVRNGEILASASSPSYDPNIFSSSLPDSLWNELQGKRAFYNIAIQGEYPPGSTFKPLLSLYALEHNIIKPEDTIFCGGSIKVPNLSEKYRCWVYPASHGLLNLQQALKLSCDVYFYELGKRCKIEDLLSYVQKFGIAEGTGIDIDQVEEMEGFLGSPSWKKKQEGYQWFEGDSMNLGIGQGFIDVTPMQMAKVYAQLGGGGSPILPHLLLKTSQNQKFTDFLTPGQKKLLAVDIKPKAENISIIQQILYEVTQAGGTAPGLSNERVKISAKTGTAEGAPLPNGRSKQHLWLGTFSPTDKPEIAAVMLLEDSDLEFGGNLAPYLKKVILKYFELTKNVGGNHAQ